MTTPETTEAKAPSNEDIYRSYKELIQKNEQIVKNEFDLLAKRYSGKGPKFIFNEHDEYSYYSMYQNIVKLRNMLLVCKASDYRQLSSNQQGELIDFLRYPNRCSVPLDVLRAEDGGIRKNFGWFLVDFSKLAISLMAYVSELARNPTIKTMPMFSQDYSWIKDTKTDWRSALNCAKSWPFIKFAVLVYRFCKNNGHATEGAVYEKEAYGLIRTLVGNLLNCTAINPMAPENNEARSTFDKVFFKIDDLQNQFKDNDWTNVIAYHVKNLVNSGKNFVFGSLEDDIRKASENALQSLYYVQNDSTYLTTDEWYKAGDDYLAYIWNAGKNFLRNLRPDPSDVNKSLSSAKVQENRAQARFEQEQVSNMLSRLVAEYLQRLVQAQEIVSRESIRKSATDKIADKINIKAIEIALERGGTETAAKLLMKNEMALLNECKTISKAPPSVRDTDAFKNRQDSLDEALALVVQVLEKLKEQGKQDPGLAKLLSKADEILGNQPSETKPTEVKTRNVTRQPRSRRSGSKQNGRK